MSKETIDVKEVRRFLKEQNSKALSDPNSVQIMYRPVLQSPVPAAPRTEDSDYIENYEWWKEQTHRCIYGWEAPDGKFINPMYYFFLNFCQVYIENELVSNKNDWQSPLFRDGDEEYFNDIYDCMPKNIGGEHINAVNYIVAKARRKGWTTCELFGITMWYFLFKSNRDINRSYPNDIISAKERMRFKRAYDLLHPFFRYDENGNYLSIVLDNEDGLTQGYKENNKNKLLNSIWLNTVSKKNTGIRGDNLGLVVVVEAGAHTTLSALIVNADATLGQGARKHGPCLIGGTSDQINNESQDYKESFYNPETISAIARFTPANKCFLGAINYFTGESHLEYAKHLIKIDSDKKSQGNNTNALKMRTQEHPMSPEEAFIPSGSSEYDQDKIDSQLIHIMENGLDKEWITGKLEWERDALNQKTGNVIFRKDPYGLWKILDVIGLPDDNIKGAHIAGIDDVYKDVAPWSTSKNCMVIWRKDGTYYEMNDLPVAYYLGRHKNRLLDYEEFEKGQKYWGAMIQYEYNDSGGFSTYARENKFLHNFIYHNDQPGIRLSAELKGEMTRYGISLFRDDRHVRILNSQLMGSFKLWGGEKNSDIASAIHLCLFGLEKTKKIGTKNIEEEKSSKQNFIRFGQAATTSGYFKFG